MSPNHRMRDFLESKSLLSLTVQACSYQNVMARVLQQMIDWCEEQSLFRRQNINPNPQGKIHLIGNFSAMTYIKDGDLDEDHWAIVLLLCH